LEDKKQENIRKKTLRMDFIQEIVSSRELENGTLECEFILKPDPKRYDKVEKDGEIFFKDKFTDDMIPLSAFDSLKLQEKIPIFYTPPKEKNLCEYLKKIEMELLVHWDEKYELKDLKKLFEELLNKLRGKDTQIVILFVDMEGSTRISSTVDSDMNIKIIKIFLMQMARIIDNFNGYVLKFVGDCAIGIFPADINFTSMCDNAVQAAMTMRNLVEEVINPIFNEKNLPQIGFHIGIDIGSVRAERIGAVNIASFDDLIGYSMNLTAKIQSKAGHNEILLGRNLFERIHVRWQEYCKKVDLGSDWKMKNPIDGTAYEVYQFLAKWQCEEQSQINIPH